MLLHIFIN